MAGMPAGEAGTLIITLGRPMAFHSRRASAIVRSVSLATAADTSKLTNPSLPAVRSNTSRSTPAAARMSSSASASNRPCGSIPGLARSTSLNWSS